MERMTPSHDALLVEYAAANDAYMHYDNFTWQVGALLIAGAFAFWGLITQGSPKPDAAAAGAAAIAVLIAVWGYYGQHCRQIYLTKLDRIHEIEALLGMEQHRRWRSDATPVRYRSTTPHGHRLDTTIHLLIGGGTAVIVALQVGWNSWTIGGVVLSGAVTVASLLDIERRSIEFRRLSAAGFAVADAPSDDPAPRR